MDPEGATANSDAAQEEAFNRILLEQSSVFHRLYDAAERRKERLEQRRLEESKMERLESKRMSNVSKAINPRSRAMAEISRGSQDVFKRLYDEGKKANAKKEQEKIRAESNREQEQLSERASEYDKTRVLGPFQPDIGPAARQYHRKGKLLESLDVHGKRKRQELLLRDAVHRAQNMQGCTFHPHIGQKSKEIANTRREKSVYEDLYEESVRRRMQRASKISCPSIHSSQSMIFRFFFYDFLYFYYCLLYSVLVLPAIHLLIVPISHTVLCANYPKYSLIETCIDINTMAAHSFR